MADIDVVPKRRSLTWMWILAAIVIVAVLLWAIMGNNEAARVGVLSPAVPAAGIGAGPALQLSGT